MTFHAATEEETKSLGARLAKTLASGALVALRGDLGAGKTTFVQGMARGLGITGRVTSPTFAIVNEYEGAPPLFHFDLYRLEGADELFDIGWEDYVGRQGIMVVEWSERAPEVFGDGTIFVTLSGYGEDGRTIDIEPVPHGMECEKR